MWISLNISPKFVPGVPINNIPALVPIMVWRRSGAKPLSKPMMVSLLTRICVTRPQWIKIGHISRIRTWSSLRRIMLLLCMIDFTHIFQDYSTGTETIERLPQFQTNNPEECGQINEMNPLVTDKNYNKIKQTLYGLFWLVTLGITGPLCGESTGCMYCHHNCICLTFEKAIFIFLTVPGWHRHGETSLAANHGTNL